MRSSEILADVLGLPLGGEAGARLDGAAEPAAFPAGRIVLREGESSSTLYVILEGLVRGYYLDEKGNDVTKCFSAEGGVFSSEGLRTHGPSSFYVECLEPCRCLAIPYAVVEELAADPLLGGRLERFFRAEVGRLERRSRDLVLLTAGERYAAFCRDHPGLSGRVAQRHIASYIGIQPQSLSRIRKKYRENSENEPM